MGQIQLLRWNDPHHYWKTVSLHYPTLASSRWGILGAGGAIYSPRSSRKYFVRGWVEVAYQTEADNIIKLLALAFPGISPGSAPGREAFRDAVRLISGRNRSRSTMIFGFYWPSTFAIQWQSHQTQQILLLIPCRPFFLALPVSDLNVYLPTPIVSSNGSTATDGIYTKLHNYLAPRHGIGR